MKTLRNRSLRFQLVTTVLLLSTLPLLLLSVFSVRFISNTHIKNATTRTEEITKNATSIIQKDIQTHLMSIQEFSDNLLEFNLLEEGYHEKTLETMMYQYLMGDINKLNLYLVKETGAYVGTDVLPRYYELPRFHFWGLMRRLKDEKEAIVYPNYIQTSDTFYNSFSIAKTITNEQGENFYLILDISTEYVQNLLNSIKGKTKGYVQFIITTKNDQIIYNDSGFNSPIVYLDNVFRYERLDEEESEKLGYKLDEIILVSDIVDEFGIAVYGMVPKENSTSEITNLSIVLSASLFVTATVSILIGILMTQRISRPIYALLDKIRLYRPYQVKDEDPDKKRLNEIDELSEEFSKLVKRIEIYRKEDIKKQELLRLSEIKSLMSQINPHFLNNTLDTIKWKAKLENIDDIADMTTQLSVLLKASMSTEPFVSIQEEIKFIDSYASLQLNRYADKFVFNLNVDPLLSDYIIPKLILQPLVENAIIHSVEPSTDVVEVDVLVMREDEKIYFLVEDNGLGFDQTESVNQESIGLTNIKNRLKLHYGEDANFFVNSIKGIGTIAMIEIKLSRLKKVSYD